MGEGLGLNPGGLIALLFSRQLGPGGAIPESHPREDSNLDVPVNGRLPCLFGFECADPDLRAKEKGPGVARPLVNSLG